MRAHAGGRKEGGDGIRGLKGVGVRELTYRLMFIANAAQVRLPACQLARR